MITKEILATMLASHTAFGAGDLVELTYMPFKGDVFGSTRGLVKPSSYSYTEVGDQYQVISYNNTTGIYTVNYDEGSWGIPFYCLKLLKKSDGRDVMVGSYSSRISNDGKSIEVGCQTVKYTEVKNVLAAMEKVQMAYKPKPRPVAKKKPLAKKKAR